LSEKRVHPRMHSIRLGNKMRSPVFILVVVGIAEDLEPLPSPGRGASAQSHVRPFNRILENVGLLDARALPPIWLSSKPFFE
jgi:hypothetical protein